MTMYVYYNNNHITNTYCMHYIIALSAIVLLLLCILYTVYTYYGVQLMTMHTCMPSRLLPWARAHARAPTSVVAYCDII